MSYLHTSLPRVHYLHLNGPVWLGLESSLVDKSLCSPNTTIAISAFLDGHIRSNTAPPLTSQVICVIHTAQAIRSQDVFLHNARSLRTVHLTLYIETQFGTLLMIIMMICVKASSLA